MRGFLRLAGASPDVEFMAEKGRNLHEHHVDGPAGNMDGLDGQRARVFGRVHSAADKAREARINALPLLFDLEVQASKRQSPAHDLGWDILE